MISTQFSQLDAFLKLALGEDVPFGDITSESVFGPEATAKAQIKAKQAGVIAGLEVAERVFALLGGVSCQALVKDSEFVKVGQVVMKLEGQTLALLAGERVALNLLQHMSGVATLTRAFCDKVADLPVKIVDTRKTTPGLRALEKLAVRIGGGSNHRYCLSDGVLIKDNHIKAAGGISQAVQQVRAHVPHTVKIELEVESLAEVKQALTEKVEIIMLDNMTLAEMAEAVKVIDGRALVEASGNVTLEGDRSVRAVAETGVDIISVGALTHSAAHLDLSMKFV